MDEIWDVVPFSNFLPSGFSPSTRNISSKRVSTIFAAAKYAKPNPQNLSEYDMDNLIRGKKKKKLCNRLTVIVISNLPMNIKKK